MFKLLVLVSIITYTTASDYSIGSNGPALSKTNWNSNNQNLVKDGSEPQVIDVQALDIPVRIVYNSRSSNVIVQQVHHPAPPREVESTRVQEEPHRVVHEIVRPVIQELKEVIIPYRRIVQEIQPVQERVQTLVSRGDGRRDGGDGGVVSSSYGSNQGSSGGSSGGSSSGSYDGSSGSSSSGSYGGVNYGQLSGGYLLKTPNGGVVRLAIGSAVGGRDYNYGARLNSGSNSGYSIAEGDIVRRDAPLFKDRA